MPATVSDSYVYLDYAATAPLCEEAAAAMAPFQEGGRVNIAVGTNANSLHSPGRLAFEKMEQARKQIASLLGAKRPDEIVITGGATEADNAALFGLYEGARRLREQQGKKGSGRVIVSAIEHDAVLAPAQRLKSQGVDVVTVTPDSQGFIRPESLGPLLTDDTLLVSVQLANSEVGSVQPIKQLAELAHSAGALFHTDAVQALGKVPVNVEELGVDAASFSAHKIGGPKGVGALYLKARTPFVPVSLGGGQERGLRSGTQNVAGMVGFAAALQSAVDNQAGEAERLAELRDNLYTQLSAIKGLRPTVTVDANSTDYLPNIVHVLAEDLESQTLILRYDMLGFGVSGGSACSSQSLEPSHVLRAMGVDADEAQGALRISMGRYTTQEDIETFLEATQKVFTW